MKIYICLMCLVAVVSAYYPGDAKMGRLSVVGSEVAQPLDQKILMPSDKNCVFSPFSVQMTMTNVALGAHGITVNEMYDVLQLSRFDGGLYKPHEAYSNLREKYSTNTTDGKVIVVNGIYVNPKISLNKKFINSTNTYYLSDLSSHDLTNPLGPEQKVNEFFKNKTGGVIQNIVKPGSIDSTTEIVLVSALTVATQWLKPFFANKTKKEKFNINSTTSIQVDMLHDDYRDIGLKQGFHGADIAELPCHGRRYSVFFLLPQTSSSLAEQEKSLTAVNRSKELFTGLSPERVLFSMPKMRIESNFELSPAFKALGMAKAFDPTQADFTAMNKTGGSYISKYFHQVVFEINENGTGAVPGAAFNKSSSILDLFDVPGLIAFDLNRPFIMFLRDNLYNIILYQGKYTGK